MIAAWIAAALLTAAVALCVAIEIARGVRLALRRRRRRNVVLITRIIGRTS